MSLYREMPKEAILSELRKKFTPEELEIVKDEIYVLLASCTNMDDFRKKVAVAIKGRKLPLE
jgi:hypothetical protein